MTDNYQLILPMMITTVGATLVAQWLGAPDLFPDPRANFTARCACGGKAASPPVNPLSAGLNLLESRIVKGAWPQYAQ